LWPAADAIGQLVDAEAGSICDSCRGPAEVVGIAADIASAAGEGTGDVIVYAPRGPSEIGDTLLVRVDHDPAGAARAIHDVMRALDPNTASEPRTMAFLREDLAARFMRIAGMVLFLGVVAIGLAMMGVYGVAAFSASRRTKEMGIRSALGATRMDLVQLILRSGAKPIGAGVGIGLIVAVPASRAVARVLVRLPIASRDPLVFIATGALVFAVALAAMFGPARHAASADPIHALRQG
jgi:putative ABC transport system permease protein